jgi:dipeptidyl aminopeptidase/acylaminoacyl peptidase
MFRMSRVRGGVVRAAVLAAVALGVVPSAAERRPIAETDLLSFVWVADPQIAPDGSRVAFVRVSVNRYEDQYESSIWVADADGRNVPRRLTTGPRDTGPRWSADGTRLAFVRSPDGDGRPHPPQIYVMPMTGGEARVLTEMPRGAANPAWSPDGSTIAFSSATRPSELPEGDRPDNKPRAGEARRDSDVRVITDAAYRANGVAGFGYVDPDRPAHIWTIAVQDAATGGNTPKQITSGEFAAGSHQWSPDGREIYFTSNRRRDSYYYPADSDLYAAPAAGGGQARRVIDIDGTIGPYAFSPDGKRIAFIAAANARPERSYDQPDLWMAESNGGRARNLTTGYDFDIGGAIGGDQRAPRGQLPAAPIWDASGTRIYVRTGEQGNAVLATVDASSGRVERTIAAQDLMAVTANTAASRFAMVVSTPTTLGDLVVADAASGLAPVRLTSFNDALFAELSLTVPEEIWYPSFDGRRIQGWILKPPDFDPRRKYPLVLQIHGGPHSAYGNTFTHEFAWMAATGYVVLYTNPRGSSNYGQEFGNSIQFNYPGDDYKDLMAGVDAVLKKGYIDERQLGVTGGSGGGLLTNWTVTQTTRFRAAVSQRDIADWANFWYTADFTLFTPTWFRKPPFEDPADFARRSPITHVAKIQTPLMFILGDEDWRTPPSAGGEDLFRALKYLKRPTVMVRFPGENHELSRSGRPSHRVERLQHIVGWFDKYLTRRTTGTYEPQPER